MPLNFNRTIKKQKLFYTYLHYYRLRRSLTVVHSTFKKEHQATTTTTALSGAFTTIERPRDSCRSSFIGFLKRHKPRCWSHTISPQLTLIPTHLSYLSHAYPTKSTVCGNSGCDFNLIGRV